MSARLLTVHSNPHNAEYSGVTFVQTWKGNKDLRAAAVADVGRRNAEQRHWRPLHLA